MSDFENSLLYRPPEPPEAKIGRLEKELADAQRLSNAYYKLAEDFHQHFESLRRYIELREREAEPVLCLSDQDREFLKKLDAAFSDDPR